MARKPNYGMERRQREQARQNKAQERQKQREEESAQRKIARGETPEDPEGPKKE